MDGVVRRQPCPARRSADSLTRRIRIRTVRGLQIILDADLAEVYGVPTRVLNQAVRRNRARFPEDFAFQLAHEEMVILRSQIVISSSGHGGRRHSAWAFTEHGAIMAAAVLNSARAVQMSVFVVRAFVRLKDLARGHAAPKAVFAALRAIIEPPKKAGRPIGFRGK